MGRKLFLELEKQVMRGYYGLQQEMAKPVILGCCLSQWESQAVCDLQPVACLGCCTAAPAVEIDGKLLDKEAARNTIIKLKSEK